MDLAYIDYLASRRSAGLGKSGVACKLLFCLSCLVVCLVSRRLAVTVGVLCLLFGCVWAHGLSPARIIKLLAYPLFFSMAFLFGRLFAAPTVVALLLCRAVSAVLSLVLLMLTTPFPDLFGFLSRFLPKGVVSSLFFCYRMFFILLTRLGDAMKSMRIRGALRLRSLPFYLKNMALVLGGLLIGALDTAARMQTVYAIRGFQGVIYSTRARQRLGLWDAVALLSALVVVTVGVVGNLR